MSPEYDRAISHVEKMERRISVARIMEAQLSMDPDLMAEWCKTCRIILYYASRPREPSLWQVGIVCFWIGVICEAIAR